ncbi:MAG TPA: hypothetical protein VME70_13750 [Mycobacteriales bacterium]|nr:hypothetical protein [Mycobacteriales bacterium]
MGDDDDRPLDFSSASDHGWPDPDDRDPALDVEEWANLIAPDDISSLTKDISAYHRELWLARRRAQLRRLAARPAFASIPLVLAAVAVAVLVATLINAMEPHRDSRPPAALPLAHPTIATGQAGGLLPDVALQDSTGPSVSARSLRPALLALVPLNCHCVPLLDDLAGQAGSKNLPLVVIAPSDAEAGALAGQIDQGMPTVLYDSSGRLATAVGAQGISVVTLARDGTIYTILRKIPPARPPQVSGELTSMLADQRASG